MLRSPQHLQPQSQGHAACPLVHPTGVIRSLHEMGRLEHTFCTETRPYNQGARLTAFELVYEQIPATLITDSMAAAAMAHQGVSGQWAGHRGAGSAVGIQSQVRDLPNSPPPPAVVVGADRVVANGDTANKIGTYQLAIVAKHHGIPFYVAAPSSSCDLHLETGREIVIEERPSQELTDVNGVRIAAQGKVWAWHSGCCGLAWHELLCSFKLLSWTLTMEVKFKVRLCK